MESLAILLQREDQKQIRKILISGLKAIENLTEKKFKGLKQILKILKDIHSATEIERTAQVDKEAKPFNNGIRIRDEFGRGWNRPGIGVNWRNFLVVDSGNGDKLFVDPTSYKVSGNIKELNTK